MSGLQLGDNSVPEMGPRPENVTSCGPGPSPDVSNPPAQHPLSSTPNKPLTEQPHSSDVSATASSEQLGSTIPAASNSTLSATGFESAADLFLGESSSNVPAVQSTDPGVSGSVGDSEMAQDPAREKEVEMDTTHQSAYTQHGEGSPSIVQPSPSKLSSPGADQALQLMGQLFRAHQAGNLADVTSQLQGPQADQLRQLMQLAQAVARPLEGGQGKTSEQPESGTDSNPESAEDSGSESDSVRTDASGNKGCKSDQQQLEDSGPDVITIDEQLGSDGLDTGHTVLWGSQAELEEPSEADWATRFPT